MDLALAGKVAVVTGASKGIGLAATRALVDEGASVVAGARSVASLEAIDGVTSVAVDLTAPDGPSQLIERAIEVHGRVDVLVNNVGAVRIRTGGFLGTSDEEFAWSMSLNFFAGLRTTRAAIVHMLDQGGGAIVNVASINSFYQPDAGTIDYGAAKAAVVNLSKSIAQEFGPRGIRINSISPGPVATDFWLGPEGVASTVGKAMGVDADTARERIVAGMGGIPSGRFTSPEEVATLIVMLASERAANVTGANYVIDGGLIKTT
jgi:NAD(P)-dependent dehydrogenase (short-subunit alcohol dehydrogenase family)